MWKIIFSLIIFVATASISLWFNTITLKEYQNYKKILEKYKINPSKAKKLENYLNKQKCYFFKINTDYYLTLKCFKENIQFMPFTKAVDKTLPFVKGFKEIYKINSKKFFYTTAQPEFFYTYDLDKFVGSSNTDNILLAALAIWNYYIKVPEIFLAFKQVKNYSFYVSVKNLSNRNKSRLNNFFVAIKQLDKYILKPNEVLNFNKLIANLPGYHKNKNEKKKYLFYWWVCWVSTMLFRNSLINPFIKVLERHSHAQRYAYFYDEYIWWDDASVYEYIKKLVIKNISNFPIYFRIKKIQNEIYLVSIVPTKTNKFTLIEKYQIWKLKAYLSSTTFDNLWSKLYQQTWISNYIRKNYER